MKTTLGMKRRFLLLAAFAALTVCAAAQEVKIGMVNEGTRRFLEEVDYSADTAYTVSYAREYRKNLRASDRPKPVTVTWTEGNAAKVLVSPSPLFEAATEVPVEANVAEIYNLVPGVKYYYKVLDGEGKVLSSASFTPVGPLRMIAGVVSNMRDLGGWKADGGHIAYGKLYRGAALSSRRTTDRAKEIFKKDLGISVDLDLRHRQYTGTLPAGDPGHHRLSGGGTFRLLPLRRRRGSHGDLGFPDRRAPGRVRERYVQGL